jgi:Zn-dependent peptidase ImmA (M78 family)
MGNQHTGKVWHQDELKKLAEMFPRTDTNELAKVFNCSVKVIQNKAYKMGISKDPTWHKEYRRKIAQEAYKKSGERAFGKKGNMDIHRPKKGHVLTKTGFQEIKTVPGGRIIRHMISDVRVR